jgi:hypothetical protein
MTTRLSWLDYILLLATAIGLIPILAESVRTVVTFIRELNW